MTITSLTTFTVHTCGKCGVQFAMADEFYRARVDDHATWYCPNGHGRCFSGENELERTKRQLERANRRAANADENARAAHASLVATKGHLTRARKRAAHGVCPCCSRTFADVQRHVSSQHPDFVKEHSTGGAGDHG